MPLASSAWSYPNSLGIARTEIHIEQSSDDDKVNSGAVCSRCSFIRAVPAVTPSE